MRRIYGLAILVLAASAWGADVEAELAAMLAARPEADTNGDGKLSEQEAAYYMLRVRRKGRTNSGTGIGDKSLIDSYEAHQRGQLRYRLMRPLALEQGKRYPLIVSLHGSGGTGDDNVSNLRIWNGFMARPAWREKYPAYVLVPQHGPGEIFGAKPDVPEAATLYVRDVFPQIFELIDEMAAELPIDPQRIYALGASGGGAGTWNMLAARPQMFAAGIPVCGRFNQKYAQTLKDMPLWVFHGDADPLIPVEESRRAFEALSQAGGNIKYTELHGVGHDSWVQGFRYKGDDETKGYLTRYSGARNDRTADVWEWLFAQRLGR